MKMEGVLVIQPFLAHNGDSPPVYEVAVPAGGWQVEDEALVILVGQADLAPEDNFLFVQQPIELKKHCLAY